MVIHTYKLLPVSLCLTVAAGWPKLLWFVTESKHLSKPPRDWFPHIKDANNDTAYIEVSQQGNQHAIMMKGWVCCGHLDRSFDLKLSVDLNWHSSGRRTNRWAFFCVYEKEKWSVCCFCLSIKPVRTAAFWASRWPGSLCSHTARLSPSPAATPRVNTQIHTHTHLVQSPGHHLIHLSPSLSAAETIVNVLDFKKDVGLWHGILTVRPAC